MSEISPLTDSGKPQARAGATHERVRKVAHTTYPEMQSATRFPIKLPVSVKSGSGQSYCETQNVSANGVFFQMESEIPLGSTVNFTIQLPASVLGTESDVQVACRGRVVRSAEAGHGKGVGVVIDEYRFERR
jgi:PilZ domain